MPRRRQSREKGNVEDEASKNSGSTVNETSPPLTFDDYQCSGNVEVDFPALCALLNICDAPSVRILHRGLSNPQPDGKATEKDTAQENAAYSFKPCVEVETDEENFPHFKSLKIFGWKLNTQIFQVLLKMLPSVKQLHCIRFWQAGLTDQMVRSLTETFPLCFNLRVVIIEGNRIPEQSYHLLLSENSVLTQLTIRNNQIGDEGARLIGSALSTPQAANNKLLLLNLAFNSIGDAGAASIAQGLRLNRTLQFLSLSNNHIGDLGAAELAAIFSELCLTHEEVVERRRLLWERAQSSLHKVDPEELVSGFSSTSLSVSKGPSKKKEAPKEKETSTTNKGLQKSSRKASTVRKSPPSKGGRPQCMENELHTPEGKASPVTDQVEALEVVHPLLEQSVYYKHGQLLMPGNTTLVNLNLSRNRITEKSLPLFLEVVDRRRRESKNLRLPLKGNLFSEKCESAEKTVQLMATWEELTPKPLAGQSSAY